MPAAYFGQLPQQQQQPGPVTAQTSYFDPTQAQQTINQVGAGIPQAQQQLSQGIQNPTASPIFTGQLQGLLNALRPQEQQQQQDLTDVFRGAGNMASGAYGGAASKLIGQQGLNRGQLTSQLMGQTVNQLIQALLPQALQGPSFLDAMKLQQHYSPTGGGAGGAGGAGGVGGGLSPYEQSKHDWLMGSNWGLGVTGGGGGGGGGGDGSYFGGGGVNPGGGTITPGYTGASTGVNYDPNWFNATQQSANYDPNSWMTGATMFGPGGQFMSSSGPEGTPWSSSQDQWESPFQNLSMPQAGETY